MSKYNNTYKGNYNKKTIYKSLISNSFCAYNSKQTKLLKYQNIEFWLSHLLLYLWNRSVYTFIYTIEILSDVLLHRSLTHNHKTD